MKSKRGCSKMPQFFDIFAKRKSTIKNAVGVGKRSQFDKSELSNNKSGARVGRGVDGGTEIQKERIIVDYREKNSLVPSYLKEQGLEVEFRELKVADYIVKNVAIERKTVSDFISSMINHHLVKQLEDLQQYEKRLLMIEGVDEQDLYTDKNIEEQTGMHPNSIRGFLLSIVLNYKVPIIFTKNPEDTAKFIRVLAVKKEREMGLNAKRKSFNKKEQLQFIIESFPSIGPKTAKKLLEKFGSVKSVINASKDDLKETIGKKGEIIYEIINSIY